MGAAESSLKSSLDFDNMDLYEVLGISNEASEDEIRRAYRQRALETHPDKNINDIEGATKRFGKVLEAYETLADPMSRSAYDYEKENKAASEAQQPSTADSMPGKWGAPDTRPSSGGWFDWLFSGWREPTDPLLRYIPEEYKARNARRHRPQGISIKDIIDYISLCGGKANWEENGRDQSLFTLFRNLFECLAYDEKKWGNDAYQIPDFGCGHSAWCPDDDPHAQHYAQDFYEYWLNFKTRKTFDWVNPYQTALTDPWTLRKVAKLNEKIHMDVRNKYDDLVRTIVDSLLRSDPRFLAHVYSGYYTTGRAPQNEFYAKFIKRCRARTGPSQAHPTQSQQSQARQSQAPQPQAPQPQAPTLTRNQRKKQAQRNKAKQKKSW